MLPGQLVTPTIRLVHKIGRGGMGTVWAAEDLDLECLVAVKLLDPDYAIEDRAVMRFRQEAQRAAKVRNPHVTTVFAHGMTDRGEPYIVMELLEGETLRSRLERSGALSLDEVNLLFGQMAKGLAAAHKLGVVHRDIKPDNLFILDNQGDPFVKIVDFGIAKQMDVPPDLTTSTMMVGTPPYMSPEQYMAPKQVDWRTDLWSLGIVVYEAITGKRPFSGETPMATALAITKGEYKPPSFIKPGLPRFIDEWMAKALAAHPGKRFESAKDMAEALSKILNPNSSQRPPPVTPTALVAGDAPTVLAPPPVKLTSAKKEEYAKARPPRPPTPPTPPDSLKAPEAAPTALGTHSELEISEDPRGFHSLRLPGTMPRVMAFDDTGNLLVVAFVNGRIVCVDFATNPQRWWYQTISWPRCVALATEKVVVGSAHGMIRVFKRDRGSMQSEISVNGSIREVAMSANGNEIGAVDDNGRLTLWSSRWGHRKTGANAQGGICCIAFHQMKSHWITGARDGTISIWDEYLRPVAVFRNSAGVNSIAVSPDGSQIAVGGTDGNIVILNSRWKFASTLGGHTQPISSLAFFRRGDVLVSTSKDGILRYLDVRSGKTLLKLGTTSNPIECMAASVHGLRSASGAANGTIRVYRWPIDPSAIE